MFKKPNPPILPHYTETLSMSGVDQNETNDLVRCYPFKIFHQPANLSTFQKKQAVDLISVVSAREYLY